MWSYHHQISLLTPIGNGARKIPEKTVAGVRRWAQSYTSRMVYIVDYDLHFIDVCKQFIEFSIEHSERLTSFVDPGLQRRKRTEIVVTLLPTTYNMTTACLPGSPTELILMPR
jgi:hypothetical protein